MPSVYSVASQDVELRCGSCGTRQVKFENVGSQGIAELDKLDTCVG
jgi:hypothetical protein